MASKNKYKFQMYYRSEGYYLFIFRVSENNFPIFVRKTNDEIDALIKANKPLLATTTKI